MLFVLVAACAAFAVAEQEGIVYFIAAFLAVAAEATWSAQHLTDERLVSALAIYAVFGLVFLGVPTAARRRGRGRALEPAALGGVLLLLSIALLFFLSTGSIASASLWGLALLLAVLNVALVVESGPRADRRSPSPARACRGWCSAPGG